MDDLLAQFKYLTNCLIQSPMMAIKDPGSWVGYALLEMGSDFSQELIERVSPYEWHNETKSLVRGFFSDVKMTYASIRSLEVIGTPGIPTL
jgi:hypothetical protein